MRFELRSSDHLGIGDLDHARPAHGRRYRHGFNTGAVRQKVAGSIHMRSDVRRGRDLRQITWIALRHLERAGAFELRVARPSDHAVAQGHGDVDPFTTHYCATATIFFTVPGWLSNASSAFSSGNRPVIT